MQKKILGSLRAKLIAGLAVCVFSGLVSTTVDAQPPRPQSKSSSTEKGIPAGIAWYGVLTDGIAEAKATNRPIFLMSAAPQCAGIPGMW